MALIGSTFKDVARPIIYESALWLASPELTHNSKLYSDDSVFNEGGRDCFEDISRFGKHNSFYPFLCAMYVLCGQNRITHKYFGTIMCSQAEFLFALLMDRHYTNVGSTRSIESEIYLRLRSCCCCCCSCPRYHGLEFPLDC